MAVFLGVLLVLEMAALFGQSDEVGEDHSTEADMVERIDGTGLNVLSVVVIQASHYSILRTRDRDHWLHVIGQFLQLQAPNLVEEVSPRHFSFS
ncbi:hypothetical protein F8388_018340 [Cannabis sativa]|uniref:Uncharacterized protein n=1 Tax=Cannabis sativa TaxID=3483 RepID=A0A7J6HH59_CANSA|nr:hypothetical protein F8388_018340 [Cannabis sativa]